jgi:hypothetical protein
MAFAQKVLFGSTLRPPDVRRGFAPPVALEYVWAISTVRPKALDVRGKAPTLLRIMLVRNICNALLGALLALIAVYLLIVTFVLRSEIAHFGWSSIKRMDIWIGAPLYTLIHIYWIVIPVGFLFGLAIPLLVRKKTRRQALLYGVGAGIIIGSVFTCFSAYDFAAGTSFGADDSVKWWGRFWGGFHLVASPDQLLLLSLDHRLCVHYGGSGRYRTRVRMTQ